MVSTTSELSFIGIIPRIDGARTAISTEVKLLLPVGTIDFSNSGGVDQLEYLSRWLKLSKNENLIVLRYRISRGNIVVLPDLNKISPAAVAV